MEFLKLLPNLKGENINKLNLKISVDQDAVSFSEREVFTKCNGKCITIKGLFSPGKGEIPSYELTDCNLQLLQEEDYWHCSNIQLHLLNLQIHNP